MRLCCYAAQRAERRGAMLMRCQAQMMLAAMPCRELRHFFIYARRRHITLHYAYAMPLRRRHDDAIDDIEEEGLTMMLPLFHYALTPMPLLDMAYAT